MGKMNEAEAEAGLGVDSIDVQNNFFYNITFWLIFLLFNQAPLVVVVKTVWEE